MPRAGTGSPLHFSVIFRRAFAGSAAVGAKAVLKSMPNSLGSQGRSGTGRDGVGHPRRYFFPFLLPFAGSPLIPSAFQSQEPSSCPWAGWLIVQPQHVPSPSVSLLLPPLVWSEEGDIYPCFPSESLVPVPPSPTSSFRLSMRQGASQSIWIPSVTSCVAAGNSPHFLVSPITQLHNGATWA